MQVDPGHSVVVSVFDRAEMLAVLKAAASRRIGQIRLPSGELWATNPMTIARGEWNRRGTRGDPTYEELLAIVRSLQ